MEDRLPQSSIKGEADDDPFSKSLLSVSRRVSPGRIDYCK